MAYTGRDDMPTSALPAVASHNGGGGGGGAAASAAAAAAAAAWADSPALSRSGSETSGSDDNDVQQQQQRPATARRQRQDHDRSCGRCSSGTTSGPASAAALDDTVREEYGEHDARTMSPRRSTEEVDRMSDGARGLLIEQAKVLQATLSDIVDQVESVRAEQEKLEGGNKFLQSYIGELMQASNLNATATSRKGKNKNRSHR